MALPVEGDMVHYVTPSGTHRPAVVLQINGAGVAILDYIDSVAAGVQTRKVAVNVPRTERGAHVNNSWHLKEHH